MPALGQYRVKHTEEDRGHVTPCWVWGGDITRAGYGQANRVLGGERFHLAHRWSYTLHVGDIPDGMQLDHLCRVRSCINPDHLEPVSPGENSRRGNTGAHEAMKTHCPQGHEYTDENIYRIRSRPRARYCRACKGLRPQPLTTSQA